MKTLSESTHPIISKILRDAANSRILTDAEISKLSGHIAENAVRDYESANGKLPVNLREQALESAFIHATQASLALPRYDEGRFILTTEFERVMREAAMEAVNGAILDSTETTVTE